MTRTFRNFRKSYRSFTHQLNKLKCLASFLDQIEEEEFNPRPRDKSLANKAIAFWDDRPVASYREGKDSLTRGFYDGEIFVSCSRVDRFSVAVNLILEDENRVIATYLSLPKPLKRHDVVSLGDSALFGVEKVINPLNIRVKRL